MNYNYSSWRDLTNTIWTNYSNSKTFIRMHYYKNDRKTFFNTERIIILPEEKNWNTCLCRSSWDMIIYGTNNIVTENVKSKTDIKQLFGHAVKWCLQSSHRYLTNYSRFNTSRPSKAEFFGPGKQGKFSFLWEKCEILCYLSYPTIIHVTNRSQICVDRSYHFHRYRKQLNRESWCIHDRPNRSGSTNAPDVDIIKVLQLRILSPGEKGRIYLIGWMNCWNNYNIIVKPALFKFNDRIKKYCKKKRNRRG